MRKTLSTTVALIFATICVAGAIAQTANTPFPVAQYSAAAFSTWSINGQSPNTYTFQGRNLCNSSAQNTNFFVFNTNAPVWIADNNTANSEVVTPSAIVNTAGSCGVTVAPSNSHYTFQLKSGSGGLQEAINAVAGTNVLPATILLDRNWYAAASNVPGKTPAAIILAAAGSAGIVLEDITQSPAAYYYWNGSFYAGSGAVAAFPNLKVTSYTGISAPTALSTAAASAGLISTGTTGGTVPASSTYRLAATYVDASGGETLISTDSASTSTIATGTGSTNTLVVTSPAAAAGAIGWRLYVTAASGASASEILYSPTCTGTSLQAVFPGSTVCAIGATATISAIVTGTATVPSLGTAYPRTATSSGSFPPFTAAGTVNAAATATLATINIPAGFLNALGRSFMVCGNGFATTNGTAGTITLKGTVASIPGVTTITPFSVISPSIAASAIQVPINFCITETTAATGATGTLEVHGWVDYGVAGTAVGSLAQDNIFAVSSTVDLTKQDQLSITITPTTAGLTAAQIRQLNVYSSN